MCDYECFISSKSVHSSLLSLWDRYLNKLKYQSQNSQKIRSGEISNHLFETYKNYVMPHGRHIYQTAYDMAMSKMGAYLPYQHAFTYWKYVLRCYESFPYVYLTCQ